VWGARARARGAVCGGKCADYNSATVGLKSRLRVDVLDDDGREFVQ